MNDQSLGMILATAIAAPVVVVCCGGGLAMLGSALVGVTGLFSGMGGLLSALLAISVGILVLALLRMRRPEGDHGRPDSVPEPRS
ncbi:hypothetical protein D6850_17970 [Roseovarius spongiae]|uniref:Uncharacterized protein n=1 Tax=Roseovarius spongiae TaxID=2320272 RepID=A0A3A8AUI5_9RHOB|nr:hypothetical protein D6850_17970 [Roseovarius spongiae]